VTADYCDPMSQVPHSTGGDERGLGALPLLLNGAANSFRTVHVTYRTWRHEQRLQEAFRANLDKQKPRAVTFGAVGRGDPEPSETQETVRIWREGQRVRQEHHGGSRDGSYGVVDGPRWWSWGEQMCATSGRYDSGVGGGGIDRGFEVMLDPAALVGVLDLRVAGNFRIASRATLTAHAAPRHDILSDMKAPSYRRAFRALHALGLGADSYHLEVDQERGVLLAITAIRGELPFYKITTLAIGFDEPIPADTFVFRPPEGEQIPSLYELLPRPQFVTVTEAQRRAAFTILVPDRLPTGWRQQPYCVYVDVPSWSSAEVRLIYRSDTGGEHVSIVQMAAADAPQHYGAIIGDESWDEVLRDGTPIRIKPANEWLQAQAHLTRHGTFAYLNSEGLTTDELATIAASPRPAPHTDDA
jgi:hypothetical protein